MRVNESRAEEQKSEKRSTRKHKLVREFVLQTSKKGVEIRDQVRVGLFMSIVPTSVNKARSSWPSIHQRVRRLVVPYASSSSASVVKEHWTSE